MSTLNDMDITLQEDGGIRLSPGPHVTGCLFEKVSVVEDHGDLILYPDPENKGPAFTRRSFGERSVEK